MANELTGIPYERFQALMQAAIAPVALDLDALATRRPTIAEAIRRIRQAEPGFLQSTVTRTAIEQVLQTVYGLKPDVVVTSLLRPDPPPAVAPVPARVSRRFALDEDEAAPPPAPIENPAGFTVHMCIICGTFWKLWDESVQKGGGWSLYGPNERPGACCDNAAMTNQIVRVYFTPGRERLAAGSVWREMGPRVTPAGDSRVNEGASIAETWEELSRSSSPAFASRRAFTQEEIDAAARLSAKELLYGRVTISAAEIQAAKDAVPGAAFAEAARKERERALADLKRTMDSYSYGPPTLRSQELSPRENTVSIVEEGQFPSAGFDVVTFDDSAAFPALEAIGAPLTLESLRQAAEEVSYQGWDEKPDLFAPPPPRTEPLVSGRRGGKTSSFWSRLLNPRDDPVR